MSSLTPTSSLQQHIAPRSVPLGPFPPPGHGGMSSSKCNIVQRLKKYHSYTGSDIRANVAYDTFAGTSCSGAQDYEVMIWLGDFGGDIYPLSNNGYPPTPTASPYIDGTQFNLVLGSIGDTAVYSFVATSSATDFSGDLISFYNYLVDNEGFPSSYYILSIQAGSEVFTGSDVEFSTSSYTISQS